MITQALLRCCLITVETHAQVSTDLFFRLVVLASLFADEQVSKLPPEHESG